MRFLPSLAVLMLAACTAKSGDNPAPSDAATEAGVSADVGAPPLCTPGAQVACACQGGTSSVQVCQVNGTLGSCACGAAADAAVEGQSPYAACSPSAPCGGAAAICLSAQSSDGTRWSFCSARCERDQDCAAGGVCVQGADHDYCFRRCAVAADCPFANAACVPWLGDGPLVCYGRS